MAQFQPKRDEFTREYPDSRRAGFFEENDEPVEGVVDVHNVISERAVIGWLFLHPYEFHQVHGRIKSFGPYLFRDVRRQALFAIIAKLAKKQTIGRYDSTSDTAYDQTLVKAEINFYDDGEATTLNDEMERCLTVGNLIDGSIRAHVELLLDLAVRRDTLENIDKFSSDLFDPVIETEETLSNLTRVLSQAKEKKSSRRILSPNERAHAGVENIFERQEGKVSDVTTGYKRLDSALGGGLLKGTVTIVTAPTGGYKTTFAQSMARRQSALGLKVLYISMEMPDEFLTLKDFSALTGYNIDDLRQEGGISVIGGDDGGAKILEAAQIISTRGYYTYAYSGSVDDVMEKAQTMKNAIGLDVIILDYIQIVEGRGNRYELVTEISNNIRKMADSMHIAAVVLAQMSRAIYGTTDLLPALHYLKESGAIEQDATSIIGLYVPQLVAKMKGKVVPDNHQPWEESNWRASGALYSDVPQASSPTALPNRLEFQVLILKMRLSGNVKVTRMWLRPASNDIFDPYRTIEEQVYGPSREGEVMPRLDEGLGDPEYDLDDFFRLYREQNQLEVDLTGQVENERMADHIMDLRVKVTSTIAEIDTANMI